VYRKGMGFMLRIRTDRLGNIANLTVFQGNHIGGMVMPTACTGIGMGKETHTVLW
jgi:hypothetical protein